jgi:hypothetical protein
VTHASPLLLLLQVKYTTLHWRPITAFRSGYPGFQAVPDWEPLLTTPVHPEYVSGHQATVGAILEALVQTLGKEKVSAWWKRLTFQIVMHDCVP